MEAILGIAIHKFKEAQRIKHKENEEKAVK
jgi:hypothetical protein